MAATCARAAQEENARPAIPSDWEYRPFLSLPESFYEAPRPDERAVDMAYEPGGPYYQSLEYIEAVAPMLRAWYSPSEMALDRLQEHHVELLDKMVTQHYTAIHVRRGDYVEHQDRFPLMTPNYWIQSALHVLEQNPDTRFLVFSDDPDWCEAFAGYAFGPAAERMQVIRGHVRPIPVAFRTSEPADIYDLWLMSRCHAHIIANSSFSWWGAYLAKEWNVYYPDRWFGDPALQDTMWDCIPSAWKQMPC